MMTMMMMMDDDDGDINDDDVVHSPRIDTFARNSSYIFLFLIVDPMSIRR